MALNRGYGGDMRRRVEKPSIFWLLLGGACLASAIGGYALSHPPSFWIGIVGLAVIVLGLWDQRQK